MTEPAARILVDYTENKTSFFLVTPTADLSTVNLESGGRVVVERGTSRIQFVRIAGSGWIFRGFRYEPQSKITHGPIRSVEITGDTLTIEDVNGNETGDRIAYRYEIQIQLSDGTLIWIDPVIENKPGSGGGGGGGVEDRS